MDIEEIPKTKFRPARKIASIITQPTTCVARQIARNLDLRVEAGANLPPKQRLYELSTKFVPSFSTHLFLPFQPLSNAATIFSSYLWFTLSSEPLPVHLVSC